MQPVKLVNHRFHSSQETKEWAVFVIRIICMMLFLFSGYEKLASHEQFLKGLEKVAIVGSYAWLVSWSVPLMEIGIGILLAINRTAKLGLIAFISLMTAFNFYIGAVLLWAETLPCHCNILVKSLSWPQHIVFNLVFILLGCLGLRLQRKNINLLKFKS